MTKTKKYNLTDVTFIIPVRIDSIDRLENIKTVMRFLSKYFNTNIIVLEADVEEKVKILDSAQKIFIEDHNLIFHRTKYLNQMSLQSSTPYVAIWDVDVIISPRQIIDAVSLLRDDKADMVSPFDGRCYNISLKIRKIFEENLVVKFFQDKISELHLIWDQSVGGAVIVDRKKYIESGMENENFYGWGFEDFERVKRWQILEYRSCRINGPLFHLNHPKEFNSTYSSGENKKRLAKEFQKVSGMSKKQLKQYIKHSFHDDKRRDSPKQLNYDTILIITYGRSGSTLLQGILNSIDGCLVRGENNNICYHLFKAYKALLKTKKFQGYYATDPHFGSNLLNENLFLHQTRELIKAQLFGDQLFNREIISYGFKEIRYVRIEDDYNDFLDFLKLIFPNVAFVFNTRKHENVMNSDWWVDDDPNEVIRLLKNFESRFKGYMKDNGNCFHISYDDVVTKSARLKSLFSFLGAEYNDRMINHILNSPHSFNPTQEKVKKLFQKRRHTFKN